VPDRAGGHAKILFSTVCAGIEHRAFSRMLTVMGLNPYTDDYADDLAIHTARGTFMLLDLEHHSVVAHFVALPQMPVGQRYISTILLDNNAFTELMEQGWTNVDATGKNFEEKDIEGILAGKLGNSRSEKLYIGRLTLSRLLQSTTVFDPNRLQTLRKTADMSVKVSQAQMELDAINLPNLHSINILSNVVTGEGWGHDSIICLK
jgi:hypothetical protein